MIQSTHGSRVDFPFLEDQGEDCKLCDLECNNLQLVVSNIIVNFQPEFFGEMFSKLMTAHVSLQNG